MHLNRTRLSALTAAAAVVLLTAGCAGAKSGGSTATPPASSAPSASGSTAATACATPGSASAAVKVTSKGKTAAPGVSFPTPTTVTRTERTVVTAGDGTTVPEGATVSLAYSLYDAKTGKKVDTRGYGGTSPISLTADKAQLLGGLVETLVCTKEGERFAAVIPAAEAFGSQGQEQLGIGGGDSLVIVGDLIGIVPTKASGTPKALPSGFPKVTLASTGQPTVAIPATDPPKALKIAVREAGSGETVKTGDSVTLQYQGVLWRTGKVFDQSWGKTGPTSLATNQVVTGFGKALVGQKVGSQVVAIIPPADGYGSKGSTDGSIKGTDTMVFVIDILATAHAS